MKLTKALRLVILRQFKAGDDMGFLAELYGFPLYRIEQVIREAMIKIDERIAQINQLKPDGRESHGSDTNSD